MLAGKDTSSNLCSSLLRGRKQEENSILIGEDKSKNYSPTGNETTKLSNIRYPNKVKAWRGGARLLYIEYLNG